MSDKLLDALKAHARLLVERLKTEHAFVDPAAVALRVIIAHGLMADPERKALTFALESYVRELPSINR